MGPHRTIGGAYDHRGDTMRATILTLCLILAARTWAEDIWEPVGAADGSRLWQLKDRPEIMGVLRSKRHDRPVDWSSVQSEEAFKKVAEQKRQILSIIGISQWSADSYSWTRGGALHELAIEGTYRDNSFQKIAFWERNLFGPSETYTILVVSPDRKRPDRKSVEDFVARAKDTIASQAAR